MNCSFLQKKFFRKLCYYSTNYSVNPFPNRLKENTQKSLRIAILGCPNVGKSSLTNRLIKADVCAVSKLVDTTREVTILLAL